MTIQRQFFNWSSSGLDWNLPIYETISPNLRALNTHLVAYFGGQPLGLDDYDRPVRDGTAQSAHSYGAALDWRYEPNFLTGTTPKVVPRATVTSKVIPFLINYSFELQIDAIHDYLGDRIWRAGRTANVSEAHTNWWKKQYGAGSGMGESWARYLHIETTKVGFLNTNSIALRLAGLDQEPAPTTPGLIKDAPPPSLFATQPVNDETKHRTRWLQQLMNERFGTVLTVDGLFGESTKQGVMRMQGILEAYPNIVSPGPVDGWYGTRTFDSLVAWLAKH